MLVEVVFIYSEVGNYSWCYEVICLVYILVWRWWLFVFVSRWENKNVGGRDEKFMFFKL